jgi:peptidoglycan/xylan/chitin deacetylase (PgdA/CDA1 family)
MRLLEAWSDAGHIVGNHTYSHRRYSRVTFGDFTDDGLRCEAVLRRLPSFRKLLRFPFLDEGATIEQRDRIRRFSSSGATAMPMSRSTRRTGTWTADCGRDSNVNVTRTQRLTAGFMWTTSGGGRSSTTACRDRCSVAP